MPERHILLSIVVPTRNRARYATSMIESILELKGDDFELVVSDNSDDDDLAAWVARRPSDPRLIYKRVVGLVSMTENHNHALGMARGEFVCLIGDDDTVLPTILDGCRWVHQKELDALTPGTPVRYCWPDFVHRYWGDRQAGNVYVDLWKGRIWVGDPRREALACMRRAGQGAAWLPKLYHGIVRRSLLEELKEETGAYCLGVSPDVYLAMALARKVVRQVCTDAPLTVPGSSGGSNAGRAAMRQHEGGLKDDPHMVRFQNEIWPEGNPEFFSVETVWAQAALEAVRRARWEEMGSLFHFPHLYARCLLGHVEYLAEIQKAVSQGAVTRGTSRAVVWALILLEIGKVSGARFNYYAKRLLRPTPRGYSQEFAQFPDICSAREFIIHRFQEKLRWDVVAKRNQIEPGKT